MQAIVLESGGQTRRVDEPQVLRIGRSPDADVLVEGETVSREHLELRPVGDGWMLVDVGSRHGTHVDGRIITDLRVDRPIEAYLGIAGSGASLRVRLEAVPAAGPTAAVADSSVLGAPGPPRVPGGPPVPPAAPTVGPAAQVPRSTAVGSGSAGSGSAESGLTESGSTESGSAGSGFVSSGPGGGDPALAMTQAVGARPAATNAPQTGPDLLVRADGREHRFTHPMAVTIGRHPGNAIVCANPSVSRFHARVDPRPGGWIFSNASSAGSFVDGNPVERIELEDTARVRLGHPNAGMEVEIAPVLPAHVVQQRNERKRRQRRLRIVGVAVAAVLVVVGLIFAGIALIGDGDSHTAAESQALTTTELDDAKLAAVWIRAESTTTSGEAAEWFGSGSIISGDGMILTNAHVADPEADGLEERYGPVNLVTPEYVDIAITDDPDTRAEPAYRARLVASDGRLDAAVLQIFATFDGDEIDPAELDLPSVEIGDSDSLRTGDPITILGFPGISQSASVTVTNGLVSSFISDPALGSDRAEIDTDARIAPGNSGGMAIDNAGELVGIPSALFGDDSSTVVSGRVRAINLVQPLIDEAQ